MKITKEQLKHIIAEEFEAALNEKTFDPSGKTPVGVQSRFQSYRSQETDEDPTKFAKSDLKTDTGLTGETDFERSMVDARHGGSTYASKEMAGAGGEEGRRQTTTAGPFGKNKTIKQTTSNLEDFTDITGGESTISVNDKELKPGSKKYKKALGTLDRADTVGVEAEAENERWRSGLKEGSKIMKITKSYIIELLNEELTKTDKSEIKKMVDKQVEKMLKSELKKALEEELTKALKSKDVKEDVGEIAKTVIKKLYKDLSFHHPYIIDRIKI